MGFLKSLSFAYDREELMKWSSIKRAGYMLLPLLLYYVAHDLSQILLWGLTELFLSMGNGFSEYLTQHGQDVKTIISAAAILIGTLPLVPMLKQERKYGWRQKPEQGQWLEQKADQGRSWEQKAAQDDLQDVGNRTVVSYGIVILLSFCLAVGINIIFYQLGFSSSSENYTEVQEAQYAVSFGLGLLLYGVISPLTEETLFRGIIYGRMKRCFARWLAILLSAILFGVYHGNLVQGVYGFLLGCVITLLYEKSGNFLIPVVAHAAANLSVFVLTRAGSLTDLTKAQGLLIGCLLTAIGVILLVGYAHLQPKSNKESRE